MLAKNTGLALNALVLSILHEQRLRSYGGNSDVEVTYTPKLTQNPSKQFNLRCLARDSRLESSCCPIIATFYC